MLVSKNTEIITKIKFSFEFDDKMNKDMYLKTNDIALIKFFHGDEVITCQGKVTDILVTEIERNSKFSNIDVTYTDAVITFDCSKFYDGQVYKILSRSIIDLTIVRSDPELKGEPGDTQDLTEIFNRLDALEKSIVNKVEDTDFSDYKSNVESTYLDKTTASNTYLDKTTAETTYLDKESAKNTYLDKTTATETYLDKTSAENVYLDKTTASNTYLDKTTAETTYLDKTTAESTYTKKTDITDMATNTSVAETYATKTEISDTYAKKTDISDMATKTEVSGTYAKKTDITDMATNTSVSETYATKTDVDNTYAKKTDISDMATKTEVSGTYLDKVSAESTYSAKTETQAIEVRLTTAEEEIEKLKTPTV